MFVDPRAARTARLAWRAPSFHGTGSVTVIAIEFSKSELADNWITVHAQGVMVDARTWACQAAGLWHMVSVARET
jgi:hypothetical protein